MKAKARGVGLEVPRDPLAEWWHCGRPCFQRFSRTSHKTRCPGYPCTRHVAFGMDTTPHATTQRKAARRPVQYAGRISLLSNLLLAWTRGRCMDSTPDHLVQTTPPISWICLHWVEMGRDQSKETETALEQSTPYHDISASSSRLTDSSRVT